MNQHLAEIAEQAKQSVPQGLAVDKWIAKYNEILADLIIRDCIKTLQLNGYDDAADCLSDVNFGINDAP